MKILANDGISSEGKKILEKAGYSVSTEHIPQTDLSEHIKEQQIDILLVRSATNIRKDLIDANPSLKLLGRGGVGMDNIDVSYAKEKGLKVINTPASSSRSVAELVMGHFFSGARFLNRSFDRMADENFSILKKEFGKGIELAGKTLVIIGFGRIGQSLASYALGCGMHVRAVGIFEEKIQVPIDIIGHGKIHVSIQVETDLHLALADADFISLHIPKQENGKAVIGKEELEIIKNGAIIVNAARGGVIDEKALLEETNKFHYVGLDVFENEPYPNKDLLENAKIGATPHIGAATIEAQDRIGAELAEQIIATFGTFA